MTLAQILEILLREHPLWVCVGIVLLSMVTVKRLELPVWAWLSEWGNRRLDGFGKRLNATTNAELRRVQEEQNAMREAIEALQAGQRAQAERAQRDKADLHREQILRFNMELTNDMYHDRESFVEVLAHIDQYEAYCREHPDYPNSRADAAIDHIRRSYKQAMDRGFIKIKLVKED